MYECSLQRDFYNPSVKPVVCQLPLHNGAFFASFLRDVGDAVPYGMGLLHLRNDTQVVTYGLYMIIYILQQACFYAVKLLTKVFHNGKIPLDGTVCSIKKYTRVYFLI